jgi:hypothetical protein
VKIPEITRPAGETNNRWEDNIKMDLIEIRWSVMNLIKLPRDRNNCKFHKI